MKRKSISKLQDDIQAAVAEVKETSVRVKKKERQIEEMKKVIRDANHEVMRRVLMEIVKQRASQNQKLDTEDDIELCIIVCHVLGIEIDGLTNRIWTKNSRKRKS